MASREERPVWRQVDGCLLLDKPSGISSNGALQRARLLFGAEKAGHGGTLDPLASGLLPVLFGEATKFGAEALEADKTYAATLVLGVTTTTGDAEGEALVRRGFGGDRADAERAVARFQGEIEQVPPMYSALKHAGRPLYAYARAGQSVPRQARTVTIHAIRVDGLDGDRLAITVRCSKGTYVRTLAEDIGETLGCGAHLAALRRLAVGAFDVRDAVGLAELAGIETDARVRLLRPVDALIGQLPAITLGGAAAARLAHGQAVDLRRRGLGGARAGLRAGGGVSGHRRCGAAGRKSAPAAPAAGPPGDRAGALLAPR